MHPHAAFGGSDAGPSHLGVRSRLRRRLSVVEENRLINLARRGSSGPVCMRSSKRLDAMVPECFGDDHPEVKRSRKMVDERVRKALRIREDVSGMLSKIGLVVRDIV